MDDSYKTISKPIEGIFKDKGSKFLSFAFPVISEDEIKNILERLRSDYHGASHYCYAYRLGYKMEKIRQNDDGEPSGSAGNPIFGQIRSKNLTSILIVVIRYFGGTLLGVGGLINAYKNAAAGALDNAKIITKTVTEIYKIEFDYPIMNRVMKMIKEENIKPTKQQFELNCLIIISLPLGQTKNILRKLELIKEVDVQLIEIQ